MYNLASWNVTALCVTNRTIFVPNIIRQWLRIGANRLLVVIDYGGNTRNVLAAFRTPRVQDMAGLDSQPEVSNVDGIPIIAWDRVKLVVATGRTTLGGCRNLALKFADTPYITWMDDDDLQRRHRVPSLLLHAKKRKDYHGNLENTNILVKGGMPLLDAETQQVKMREKRISWLEGIYYRPSLKPFPGISMSEDYHWMQQFTKIHHAEVRYPAPLAVHIKHQANTSDVRRLSTNPDFWHGGLEGLEPCWAHVFKQWQLDLGFGMFLEDYANILKHR